MNNIKKTTTSLLLAFLLTTPISFADMQEPKTDNTGFSPIEAYEMQQKKLGESTLGIDGMIKPMMAIDEELLIPGNNGILTVNSWIQDSGEERGSAISWDYLVSSVYTGSRTVKSIRTTWQAKASLRNGASISLGIGIDSASAGSGSSWQSVQTPVKYYENTNGSKGVYMHSKSNFHVTPRGDYRTRTAAVYNTGKVQLQGVPGSHEYSAVATPRWK